MIKQRKAYFRSILINLKAANVRKILFGMIYEILKGILNYQRNGSGWYFKVVLSLKIHTVDYEPLKGSSYIPLIMRKKAILNIENKDTNNCFM